MEGGSDPRAEQFSASVTGWVQTRRLTDLIGEVRLGGTPTPTRWVSRGGARDLAADLDARASVQADKNVGCFVPLHVTCRRSTGMLRERALTCNDRLSVSESTGVRSGAISWPPADLRRRSFLQAPLLSTLEGTAEVLAGAADGQEVRAFGHATVSGGTSRTGFSTSP